MRELTEDELLLVAGGAMSKSNDQQPWYYDAFDWLSNGLDWLGNAFGGFWDNYLDGWAGVADDSRHTGDLINCYDDWTDYRIDNDGGGLQFDDWYNSIDPTTCDTDSGLSHSPGG